MHGLLGGRLLGELLVRELLKLLGGLLLGGLRGDFSCFLGGLLLGGLLKLFGGLLLRGLLLGEFLLERLLLGGPLFWAASSTVSPVVSSPSFVVTSPLAERTILWVALKEEGLFGTPNEGGPFRYPKRRRAS